MATLWNLPRDGDQDAHACFEALKSPINVRGKTVSIGDSKKLFKPGVVGSLDPLRYVTWSTLRACGHNVSQLRDSLASIAEDDVHAIEQSPWLNTFDDAWCDESDAAIGDAINQAWSNCEAKLVAVRVRVITAKAFNAACADGRNKADLLSTCTLGLVSQLATIAGSTGKRETRHVDVFCDRHGGRRYYGGVLQHTFPDSSLAIESESSLESVYRLDQAKQTLRVRFTVKGDSFIPVALSSMIAKFLRECAMKSFNAYFAERAGSKIKLQPTAGYPTDADRFLADIEPIIVRDKIDRASLVRSR